MSTRRRSTTTATAIALMCLVLGASVLGTSAEASPEPDDPVVAYWTESEAIVADGDGATVRRFPDFNNMSLNSGVLAGELSGTKPGTARIVAYDAASGERKFRIRNARLPVVTGAGRKAVFFPTHQRDSYGLTVWMRNGTGRIRKIVQFAGPGVPGTRTGMGGDATPLDIALDERGRKMAVVAGLETLRSFDVWFVDVRTKQATRVTRGENSHNPSVSPDGSRLVVRVERPEFCPDPLYGEILIGKIRLIDPATGERTSLTEWSCDVFYDTPRWIDDDTLVAVRVTKDATEQLGYDLDIVEIDATTGAISDLVTEGNPCCLTASSTLGRIGYLFSDIGGFSMLDLVSGTAVDVPEPAYVPRLSGDNRF